MKRLLDSQGVHIGTSYSSRRFVANRNKGIGSPIARFGGYRGENHDPLRQLTGRDVKLAMIDKSAS
jgi:hypothetical protein